MSKVHKVKIAGKMYEYDNVSIRSLETSVVIPVRTVTHAWEVLAKLKSLRYDVICYESIGMVPIFMKVNKMAIEGKIASSSTPVINGSEVKALADFNFKL